MQTITSDRLVKHSLGESAMKAIASLAIGTVLIAAAGSASAQDSLSVTGNAEAECSLPDSWKFFASQDLVSGGTFTPGSNTWTIPSEFLSDSNGRSAGGSDIAIRIRGTSFCNTAHTISLRSQNGGLVSDAAEVPGFANRRSMSYDAYWGDGSGGAVPLGGDTRSINNFRPSTPGQTRTANYTVTDTVPPPGLRSFIIRMGLVRKPGALPPEPLLAGDYEDVLTVTLTPVS